MLIAIIGQRRITSESCVITKLLNALMPPLLDELDDFAANMGTVNTVSHSAG